MARHCTGGQRQRRPRERDTNQQPSTPPRTLSIQLEPAPVRQPLQGCVCVEEPPSDHPYMTSIQKGGKEGYEYPKLEGDLTNFVDREGRGKIQTICGLPTWKALVGQDKHTDGAAIECAQGPDTGWIERG